MPKAGSPPAIPAGCRSNWPRRRYRPNRMGARSTGKIRGSRADRLPHRSRPEGRRMEDDRQFGGSSTVRAANRPSRFMHSTTYRRRRPSAASSCWRNCNRPNSNSRFCRTAPRRRYVRSTGTDEVVLSRRSGVSARRHHAGALAKFVSLKIDAKTSEQKRRLALADWIVSDTNPLARRVIVNRIWQHHFGAGLVDTPNDFDTNGVAPTHPQLLDWLASTFVSDGWSLKKLHRRILLTQTATKQPPPCQGAEGRRRQPVALALHRRLKPRPSRFLRTRAACWI